MTAKERQLARRQRTATREGSLNRGQTAVLVSGLVIAAAAVGLWSQRSADDNRRFNAGLERYVQEHQCVVADMRGRDVKTYRCDKPEPGRYVPARELYQAVRDEALVVKR